MTDYITEGTYRLNGVERTFRLVANHELTEDEIKYGIMVGSPGEFELLEHSVTIVNHEQ